MLWIYVRSSSSARSSKDGPYWSWEGCHGERIVIHVSGEEDRHKTRWQFVHLLRSEPYMRDEKPKILAPWVLFLLSPTVWISYSDNRIRFPFEHSHFLHLIFVPSATEHTVDLDRLESGIRGLLLIQSIEVRERSERVPSDQSRSRADRGPDRLCIIVFISSQYNQREQRSHINHSILNTWFLLLSNTNVKVHCV